MLTTDTALLLFNIDAGLKVHYITRVLCDIDYSNIIFGTCNFNNLFVLSTYDMYFYLWMYNRYGIKNPNRIAYRECIEEGNIKVAKLMNGLNAMDYVLQTNNLHRIKWVYNNISTNISWELRRKLNNIEIMKWIYETYPDLEQLISIAIENDNLEFMEWYCKKRVDTNYDDFILHAVEMDKFKVFLWLYNNYNGINIIDTIVETCCSKRVIRNIDIIVWLTINFQDKVLAHVNKN